MVGWLRLWGGLLSSPVYGTSPWVVFWGGECSGGGDPLSHVSGALSLRIFRMWSGGGGGGGGRGAWARDEGSTGHTILADVEVCDKGECSMMVDW